AEARYANRNVGAVVVASDGLYNSGSNPLYFSGTLKAPVYTIALGDTNAQKDLLIGEIRYNKTAFLNNTFPVEVTVKRRQLGGTSTVLTVKEDSASLFSKQFTVTGNKFQQVIPVYLDAKKKGIHHYEVAIQPVAGEVTTANNRKDIYVEVEETKRKVLIVA